MEPDITPEDQKKIAQGIREKYSKWADDPQGLFKYLTGRAGLETLRYDPEILKTLPPGALDSFCGVGNPFQLGPVSEGQSVLDIGSGGGLDCLVAARMVGPGGKVVGIDLSPEMVARARENIQTAKFSNICFLEFSGDILPFPKNSFDVVISNGVFNLIPDKLKALRDVARVLKAEGRLMIADQILTGELPKDHQARIASWFKWEGGAIPGKDFLALMEKAGFGDCEFAGETGFNSSPITKGALFKAIKKVGERKVPIEDGLEKYREFFEMAYAEGAINRKMKHLIALGASLAAGCEPWTAYCLAVARELGATEEELKETMAIAMTVGATRIQLLQQRTMEAIPSQKPAPLSTQPDLQCLQAGPSSSGFTWATKASSGQEPKSG